MFLLILGEKEHGLIANKASLFTSNNDWSTIAKIYIPKGFTKPICNLDTYALEILKKQEHRKTAFSKLTVWLAKNYNKLLNK